MKKYIIILILFLIAACGENNQTLSKAISASSNGVALIADSKIDEGREQLLDFKGLYLRMIDNNPNNGLYHNNLGWVLIHLGEYDEAEKHLIIALKNKDSVNPKSAPEKNLDLLAVFKEKSKEI
ncbi:tetratricopeptide repeat protein [Teredinibacter sp. KSP-S5-2]|uniref:tetratricopeptide repeat protein n=1 Tax=Teredinibacter sp. KSP-S5-2 TaxID=3034506 RepID=UPI0029350468|nr:tetratricopeptide repeat protein [Teredinibacter sp. KSP-S5-2]WNO11244.1 tetratricopeptide repeat protein [Teredinibacter sp. KSP-S5-2]